MLQGDTTEGERKIQIYGEAARRIDTCTACTPIQVSSSSDHSPLRDDYGLGVILVNKRRMIDSRRPSAKQKPLKTL